MSQTVIVTPEFFATLSFFIVNKLMSDLTLPDTQMGGLLWWGPLSYFFRLEASLCSTQPFWQLLVCGNIRQVTLKLGKAPQLNSRKICSVLFTKMFNSYPPNMHILKTVHVTERSITGKNNEKLVDMEFPATNEIGKISRLIWSIKIIIFPLCNYAHKSVLIYPNPT